MKKRWLLLAGAAMLLLLPGCAGTGEPVPSAVQSEAEPLAEGVTVTRSALGVPTYELTSPGENGYATGGDQYISWYQATNASVVEDLNKRLGELGYKQMRAMKDRTELYSYDGNTWMIRFNNTRLRSPGLNTSITAATYPPLVFAVASSGTAKFSSNP